MEIYLSGARLFMVMEVGENFSFAEKANADRKIQKCKSGKNSCGNFKSRFPEQSPEKSAIDGTDFKIGEVNS
jgi:L-rhamnose mutarotase